VLKVQAWTSAIWLEDGLLQGVVNMPHKYEREIEEILRNMERTEPRRGLGDRVRAFQRPAPARPRGPTLNVGMGLPEVLLITGIVLALVGAGIAYYQSGTSLLTGLISAVGFASIVVGVVIGWWARFRGVNVSLRRARDNDDNVVRIGRRGLFAEIATQFRILRLKWRYSRRRERE
jgi:hypothetical protein